MSLYDVIVIGAGHAGVEAAWAASRIGRSVAVCTLSDATIAHMPCNPAVGGTAKGHLVREIDALGGLMGLAIDATGIQFKMLNRSRGPAVWSPRAQADKRRYGQWVARALEREPGIEWILGKAGRILVDSSGVIGIELESGERYCCRALVVTTGTFLNGLVHVGPEQRSAGRAGEPPSRDLAESLKGFGFEWGRLKTGTPPRLDRRSIDFSVFTQERGDDPPVPFSFQTDTIAREQIACHLLHTNDAEHRLLLRIDNADLRLTPRGRSIGLVDDRRWERFEARRRRFNANAEAIRRAVVTIPSGAQVPAPRALQQPDVSLGALLDGGQLALETAPRDRNIDLASVETEFKYEGYLRRQIAAVERQRRHEDRAIPVGFLFEGIPGLSREMVERLSHLRPATLGHALRIPGVTPAAVAVIAAHVDRSRTASSL